MGGREKSQKSKSLQFVAQSFAASALIAVACSHKKSGSVPPALQEALSQPSAPALNVSSLGIQLTQVGSNDSPFLSQDGKKVVFISRKRPSHQQGQVYIYDLDNLKEKRITYQDGDCRDPIFLKDSRQIIYASTTDELKEEPVILRSKAAAEPFPPTELYLSDLLGSEIQRLTTQSGFDGSPWPRWDRPQSILYSRWSGKNLEAWQMNLQSRQTIPVLSRQDRSIESLQISPDQKQWTWIERAHDDSTQIFVAPSPASTKTTSLDLPAGDYREIIWLSEQRLLLSAKSLKKRYQLYSYDLNSKCLQSLFETDTDLSSPRPHQERQGLVFVSSANGSSQIYYKSLPTSDQCLTWKTEKTAAN